jgi:hypothetical protein
MGNSDSNPSAQMMVPSILTMVGTSFIFATYALFPDLRRLKYIELVFYIAICDFLSALGMSVGDVSEENGLCYFQSALTNFSILASVAWTTVMSHELHSVLRNQEGISNQLYLHSFCWGLPLLLSVITLTTTIGTGDTWCFISNQTSGPSNTRVGVLMYLTFFVWLWLGILLILTFFAFVAVKLLQERSLFSGRGVKNSLKGLLAYPIILVFCWIIPTILSAEKAAKHQDTNAMARVFPALQGFLVSLVFASRTSVVRSWRGLFVKTRRRTLSILQMASDTAIEEESYKPDEDPEGGENIWSLSFSSYGGGSRRASSVIETLDRGRGSTADSGRGRGSTMENGFGVRPSAVDGQTISPIHNTIQKEKARDRNSSAVSTIQEESTADEEAVAPPPSKADKIDDQEN